MALYPRRLIRGSTFCRNSLYVWISGPPRRVPGDDMPVCVCACVCVCVCVCVRERERERERERGREKEN